MVVTKVTFEYAYDDIDKKYVDAEDLIEKKIEEQDYHKDYLYCPSCRKARLLVNAGPKRKYISAISKKDHDKNCPYLYAFVSKKEMKLYKKEKSPDEINNDLKSFIRMIIAFRNHDIQADKMLIETTAKTVYDVKKGDTTVKKRIPQQKLNKNLAYNFDNDVEKYYYGIVSSNEPETKQGFTNYTIKVFDGVDSVDLFTISINTDKSDLNLINKLNRLINNECEIAFFGKIIENTAYKNKYYKNVYLYKDEYLVIN